MLKRFFLSLALASLPLGSASAETADQIALSETVMAFKAAMSAGDIETVMSMVPEKVFGQMADEMDLSSEHLTTLVVEQMRTVLADVNIIEFDMQTTVLDIEETPNGIAYVFLPTRTVVDVQGTKVEAKSHTLALRDGNQWRLVRVEDSIQLRVLRDVYPGFAEVEFPRNTVRLLN